MKANFEIAKGKPKHKERSAISHEWETRSDRKRSTIVRKIARQLIYFSNMTGTFVGEVTQWKDKHGLVYYTAREVVTEFDHEQKCNVDKRGRKKYRVKPGGRSGFWVITSEQSRTGAINNDKLGNAL